MCWVPPEDLDRLLGEKPEKICHRQSSLAKRSPVYDRTTISLHPGNLREPCVPTAHYSPLPPQQCGYLSHPTPPHPASPHLPLYPPCQQQPFRAQACGGPSSGKIPLPYHASAHTDYAIVPGSVQDTHFEVDGSYDVDTLNPSLMDLQLQGMEMTQQPLLRSLSLHVAHPCMERGRGYGFVYFHQ